MQMCFIMGCRVSTQQGSNVDVSKEKDSVPLPVQQRLHSGPVQRLVYQNANRDLGTPEDPQAGKYEDKFQLDNSLQLRAKSSSALLSKTTNFLEEELPGSPSFRFYLETDLKLDLNKELDLNEKQVSSPIHDQTKGVQNKLFQLMDTPVPVLLDKETLQKRNKKKKGWKFKFLTKKNKDSRSKAPHQFQTLATSPRYSREDVAAVILQKIIRGFLLRKHLRILRNIEATTEEFSKQVAEYEKILESNKTTNFRIEDQLIMQMLSEINSVKISMVYKRKVIQKITSLQKAVNSVAVRARQLNMGTLLAKSGFVADSDDLTMKSFNFSEMQYNRVTEKRLSTEESLIDTKYSTETQVIKQTSKDIDWDPYEEDESDIVIDFYIPIAQNSNTFQIKENNKVDGVSLAEQPEESNDMVELDKSIKLPMKFGQHGEISSIENSMLGCRGLTKTEKMDEGRQMSNADKNLNSDDQNVDTTNKVKDTIRYQTLLEIFEKLKSQKEFGDHALELSQLKAYYNQTEELKEELKDLSVQSNEIKTSMKGLENMLQELGKPVQRIERGENTNVKTLEGDAEVLVNT